MPRPKAGAFFVSGFPTIHNGLNSYKNQPKTALSIK
jgi:hypothetical protein